MIGVHPFGVKEDGAAVTVAKADCCLIRIEPVQVVCQSIALDDPVANEVLAGPAEWIPIYSRHVEVGA